MACIAEWRQYSDHPWCHQGSHGTGVLFFHFIRSGGHREVVTERRGVGPLTRVLLINMPFASVLYPSMGLSVLQPALTTHGIACDVSYANILFRSYVQDEQGYDDLCYTPLLGDWVFGAALFGDEWSMSQKGSIEAVRTMLAERSTMKKQGAFCDRLSAFRRVARKFLDEYYHNICWK